MCDRQDTGHAADFGVETEFADDNEIVLVVCRQIGQHSRGLKSDDGQRKIEPGAVLGNIRWSKVDQNVDLRFGHPNLRKSTGDAMQRFADAFAGHARNRDCLRYRARSFVDCHGSGFELNEMPVEAKQYAADQIVIEFQQFA